MVIFTQGMKNTKNLSQMTKKQQRNTQFENLISLIESPIKDNFNLALVLVKHFKKEFESYYNQNLKDFLELHKFNVLLNQRMNITELFCTNSIRNIGYFRADNVRLDKEQMMFISKLVNLEQLYFIDCCIVYFPDKIVKNNPKEFNIKRSAILSCSEKVFYWLEHTHNITPMSKRETFACF